MSRQCQHSKKANKNNGKEESLINDLEAWRPEYDYNTIAAAIAVISAAIGTGTLQER